ncbi:MAG: tetratricopeptide repeat protein, partial [FCB group bacterium]|nr:tetratricopeptide repeat protein [FCB group bacterium]
LRDIQKNALVDFITSRDPRNLNHLGLLTQNYLEESSTRLAYGDPNLPHLSTHAGFHDLIREICENRSTGEERGCAPHEQADSIEIHRKSADQGDASAQYLLGNAYLLGEGVPKDEIEAFGWFRKAAIQGDARAQIIVANAYNAGEMVPVDKVESLKWYRKAADQGDALAQCCVATAYLNGDGVQRDEVEARKWFRKAANQGYAPAALFLGRLD